MQASPADIHAGRGWDERLLAWPRAHLLQSWGWGELQAGAGWEVERIALDGAPPLTVLRGSTGLPGLPPRLYLPKGPANEPGDTQAWATVERALDELASRCDAAAVTVEPPWWSDDAPPGRLPLAGPAWQPAHTTQPAHTAVVDLSDGEDAVLARMKPKGRYNIRLAAKRGVSVETPADPARAAAELARLCAATARRQGINLPGAAYFRRALDCVPSARVHLATVEGEAVSGVLVAHFAGEMIYLYGGSTTAHRDRQPSSLLHLHVIQQALAAGCQRYDLWGIPASADPADPWHGLRQFKLQLGGVERSTAGAWVKVRRPLAFRAVGVADSARRAVRRARSSVALQSRARTHPPGDT
jgi:FemAB family